MSKVDDYCKCVSDYRVLGSGRKRKKVLVGDSDDARTANFWFVTNVHQNRPACREVVFANGEVFRTTTKAVHGKRAYIFLCNELVDHLHLLQVERAKLLAWLETAPLSVEMAMADLIVEETGCEYRIDDSPLDFECRGRAPLLLEITKLTMPQLRRLTSLIDQPLPVETVASALAA